MDNGDSGIAVSVPVCKPVSDKDDIGSIVLDEERVLSSMWDVDWSYYIASLERKT